MKKVIVLVVSMLLLVLPSAIASSQSYASYRIVFSGNNFTKSFVVNESVSATSNKDYDILTFSIISSSFNLSYSRSVNASHQFFPYIAGISNQTFAINGTNYSLHASLVKNGTEQITFQGSNYALTTYSVTLSVSFKNLTRSISGSLKVFPSGLVYQASLSGKSFNVEATLLSTNLELNVPSSTSTQQAASIAIGGASVAAAFLGTYGIRRYRKQRVEKEQKDYWVD